MDFEVIDFHTHPFIEKHNRIGMYVDTVDMTTEDFFEHMEKSGVSVCCGSVIGGKMSGFESLHKLNLDALKLRDMYKGRYIPGFHVHPDYVEESIREVEFAIENGVRLIGELVPYHHNWEDYSSDGFMEIMDFLSGKNMIVNVHIGSPEDLCRIEKVIDKYKDVTFVLAHPGYGERFNKHIEINKKYENTYLDISGSGIECYGTVKKLVGSIGYERILFGTDFPVTAVRTYVSAVLSEKISDAAKEHILSKNAKKLLGI